MTAFAFMFPGQGSQFPGMARELFDASPAAHRLLEQANDLLGFRLTKVAKCRPQKKSSRPTPSSSN